MKNINKQIKDNDFSQVYLLYGEENYLKNSFMKKLKEAIISPDDSMNYSYFHGKDINFNEVIDIAETMPFFAEKRLIIIEESQIFKSANEEMANYISQIPKATYFIFVENEVDKRGRMYKRMQSIGYPCEMKRLSPKELEKWILSKISADKKKITYDTMGLFLSKTGNDMNNINNELEKLLSYAYDKDIISSEDVENICVVEVEGKIFEMIDAMGMKDTKKLFSLYNDLLAVKEPHMKMMYLVARQFNIMLGITELYESGYSNKSISEKIKMQPFIVNKTVKQLKNFKKDVIINAISDLVNMEELIKTGRLTDKIALEMFLTKYCR